MKILSTVTRTIAVVALVGAMACTTASAAWRTIRSHGYWESIVAELDGDIITGALTKMDNGATAAILIRGEDINLRLSGDWDLETGDRARVSIVVDGTTYRGKAKAINDSEYEVQDLTFEFVKAVMDARTAVIVIDDTRWTLKLRGVTASLRDAIDFKAYLDKRR
jgi:hypothetical protein